MSGSICQMDFASAMAGEESGRLLPPAVRGSRLAGRQAGRQADREGGRGFLFAINSREERAELWGGQAAAAIPATTITNVAALWFSTIGRSGTLRASWKRARESIFLAARQVSSYKT